MSWYFFNAEGGSRFIFIHLSTNEKWQNMNGGGGIGEELFRGSPSLSPRLNKRYFWMLTHLWIFRRESKRPAKCKTMKMREGEREAEHRGCVVRVPFSPRCFQLFSRATIISFCSTMNLHPRPIIAGLVMDDAAFKTITLGPMRTEPLRKITILCRCHWLSFQSY